LLTVRKKKTNQPRKIRMSPTSKTKTPNNKITHSNYICSRIICAAIFVTGFSAILPCTISKPII
jgi:hypothetical protein